MAIRGINTQETTRVIHPDDPGHMDHPEFIKAQKAGIPPEEPTEYIIGILTQRDRVELSEYDDATKSMGSNSKGIAEITLRSREAEKTYETLRRGLAGWVNQQDHKGSAVAFSTKEIKRSDGSTCLVASDESLALLPNSLQHFLVEKISETNGMTDAALKKLQAALQQQLVGNLPGGDAANVQTKTKTKEDAKSPRKKG